MCNLRSILFLCFSLACVGGNEIQVQCNGAEEDCKYTTLHETFALGNLDIEPALSDSGFPQFADSCQVDKDCENGATCEGDDGARGCKCKNGTSGQKCEIVEECVRNPTKCGTGKDVKCVYSKRFEEAICECDEADTELDLDDFKCKPCDCGILGRCYFLNGTKTCKCLYENYYVKKGKCDLCSCSTGSIGCRFDEDGSQICTCERGYAPWRGFCRECDCGAEGNCSYDGYDKICTCNPYFADSAGTCKECNCGKGLTCSFSGKGAKKCGCEAGTADNLGTCKECDCGQWSEDCKFSIGGKQLCTCRDGFVQVGDTCKECDCGHNGRCYFNGTEKVCDCNTKYQMLDGYCQECFCGFEGTCKFNEKGIKQCSCDKGFGRKKQECVPCNCGLAGVECFFGEGKKRCVCPNGFQDLNGFCEDIDECNEQLAACPSTTKCENKMGTFACSCKDGYKMKTENSDPRIHGCEDIDECAANPLICRSKLEVCFNLPGSYMCACKEGYKPTKSGSCALYSPILQSTGASTSWRTGFIVTVSLFGCIAALIVIVVIARRRPSTLTMESIQVGNFR